MINADPCPDGYDSWQDFHTKKRAERPDIVKLSKEQKEELSNAFKKNGYKETE